MSLFSQGSDKCGNLCGSVRKMPSKLKQIQKCINMYMYMYGNYLHMREDKLKSNFHATEHFELENNILK